MDYLQQTGRIFDIQRFSIHDGPGIRTIVFLKGCALRCRWCCNPESQNSEIETMTVDGDNRTVGRDVTVAEVIGEVLRDTPYYRRSGGGLTLSGGESLLQPDFASGLLRAAREAGIGTALESTGFAEFSIIAEKILPWLDLLLMDIKHLNTEKHRAFTGQDNIKILANAKKIAESGQSMIVRVPVIPTFNDTPEEIAEIAQFAASLPGVEHLHLLPYHRLGQDKYAQLNREYLLPQILPPTAEKMRLLQNAASVSGLKVQIDG